MIMAKEMLTTEEQRTDRIAGVVNVSLTQEVPFPGGREREQMFPLQTVISQTSEKAKNSIHPESVRQHRHRFDTTWHGMTQHDNTQIHTRTTMTMRPNPYTAAFAVPSIVIIIIGKALVLLLVLANAAIPSHAFIPSKGRVVSVPVSHLLPHRPILTTATTVTTNLRVSASSSVTSTTSPSLPTLGSRLPIQEDFPGLERVHADPDIFVIKNFLSEQTCNDMIQKAAEKTLERSPVAYAGWTQDFADLFELAAKGPVTWLALLTAWAQVKDPVVDQAGVPVESSNNQIASLVVHAVQNFFGLLLVATIGIAAFTKSRTDSLQNLRTSTSTTLDDVSPNTGARDFVQTTERLFGAIDGHQDSNSGGGSRGSIGGNNESRREASYFEAPTVIRYEAGQQLAPHFDANRSAATEDANRGGQTLATLLVYLNDVEQGGTTRFGRLSSTLLANSGTDEDGKLIVQPRRGDALLFFPADANGVFDERTEHEGCPAVDEKWIARIWRHQGRVPPPFGLTESSLDSL